MGFLKREYNFISYTVDKSFTKNLAISVQNGQVAVSAPWYVSRKKIEQIVLEKRNWIIEKLREYEEINKIRKLNSEKKTIKVFGEEYNLKVLYSALKGPKVNLEGKTLEVELPLKYKNIENTKILDFVIEKFYEKLAEKEIYSVMEKVRLELKISPEDCKLIRMEGKLGNYDEANRIVIVNPDIVKFDREILEYVVLHEFCHLKFKTHCKSFQNLLEKNMKNYKDVELKIKGMF